MGRLSTILAVFALSLSAAGVCLAEETPREALRDLQTEVDKFNKTVDQRQGALFSSKEQLEKLCYSRTTPSVHTQRDAYLSGFSGDPVSLPNVDCLYIHTGDGSNELLSYTALPDKAGFQTVRRSWFAPSGLLTVSKHPLHEIRLISDGSWRLNRVVLSPSEVFPIKADTKFTLTESRPGKTAHDSTVWVRKSFAIQRKGVLLDRFRLLIRDHGQMQLLGVQDRFRSWYLYSELANAVVRTSGLPRSIDALGNLDNTEIMWIGYFAEGRLALVVTDEEMAPVRKYLSALDLWEGER